jgi:predicted helicase
MAEQAHDLRAQHGGDSQADSIAQAAVCAAPILASATTKSVAALGWLEPQLQAWERTALDRAQVLSTQYSAPSGGSKSAVGTAHPTFHLYDVFLQHYSRNSRKLRGVFFTPEPIADYIVGQIDRLLREECGFADGLADERVTIIDPACGTGVFLFAVINFLGEKLNNRQLGNLLSRLIGIEILPPAALLAKLNIASKLAEIGCDFRNAGPIHILTADSLLPSIQSKIQNLISKSFPTLLGNPPFSSLSTNTNPWIARLVRGDEEIRGYVRANGQELGERKTWLHDDYVKFIRLAQWHVEQANRGIVGFVTNHGYLDNATFRLMRHELLRVFPHIEILDLHGNRRAGGADVPLAMHDENVFGLDQGIAISLLCRSAGEGTGNRRQDTDRSPNIFHSELRGPRAAKLAALCNTASLPCPLTPVTFTAAAPDWRFIPPTATPICPQYAASWSLADAMPVNTTAPVTARDHFVVAFTRNELINRINEFRDLKIPDDVIRGRYFQRTRSARYQTGDTRGWKLADARRIIAADDRWDEKIIRCLYRPFDWRFVFWHPAMIDWPRTEVTRHLIDHECSRFKVQSPKLVESTLNFEPGTLNLCLIARRQQLPTQPCSFFWISDCLALDGVIRSDNRGSESLFPLYIDQRANFALAFIEQLAIASGLSWKPLGPGDLTSDFGPEDVVAYIYALFHSPSYREKHADELRRDFPRIVLPTATEQFAHMARLGHELIDLHLLRTPHSLSPSHALPVPPAVHSFRAGGYIAVKKWLQPKHRSTADPDYDRIVAAIARTSEIMSEIVAVTA